MLHYHKISKGKWGLFCFLFLETLLVVSQMCRFEEIPSVPFAWTPFVGNGWQLVQKPAGRKQMWKNLIHIRRKYFVDEQVPMIRMRLPNLNPLNGGRSVWLFRAEDVHTLFQNEAEFPTKGPLLSTLTTIRKRMPGKNIILNTSLCSSILIN